VTAVQNGGLVLMVQTMKVVFGLSDKRGQGKHPKIKKLIPIFWDVPKF
jgi:hypothetical protein